MNRCSPKTSHKMLIAECYFALTEASINYMSKFIILFAFLPILEVDLVGVPRKMSQPKTIKVVYKD